MMTPHLTAQLAAGYRARTLSTAELLAVGEHLASCEECRQRVASPDAQGKLAEALGGEPVSGKHLSYEDLEALVLGSWAGMDHVSACAMCAEELRDLRVFHAGLTTPTGKWGGIRILVPVAGLALLAIAIAVVFPRTSTRPESRPAAPLTALRDHGQVVALDKTGGVSGLNGIPSGEQQQIAEALRTGRIPAAPAEPDLLRGRETLLGAPVPAAVLRPVIPVGTAVFSDRPAFQWQAPKGARDFRIAVYDANFELVESGPVVQGEVWVSSKRLPRGKVLSWTVSAMVHGGRVTAPHAPEPEARFRVATEDEAAQMEAVRQATPPSDLRVALTAARLGFREEAREALDRLDAQNPGSPLLARLRASVPPK
jgi:hypothetical protein